MVFIIAAIPSRIKINPKMIPVHNSVLFFFLMPTIDNIEISPATRYMMAGIRYSRDSNNNTPRNKYTTENMDNMIIDVFCDFIYGAKGRARTGDPILFRDMLYQLSYLGVMYTIS